MEDERGRSVVCLGFFDGVHRGHLALLQAAREKARDLGCIVVAHTFDHAPGSKGRELTGLPERERLLLAAGADQVAVSVFDDAMRRMTGEEFFRTVVLDRLRACHVVCGDDHRFGYKGAWGVEELEAMCREAGIGLTVVPPVTLPDGRRISSTLIREAVANRDWAAAESMLGRPLPKETPERGEDGQAPGHEE